MFRLFGIHSCLRITAPDTVIVGVRGRETSMFRALCVFSGCPASSQLSSVYAGALRI